MKVFLTGASGFLGSYLLKALQNVPGTSILCLARTGSNAVIGGGDILEGDLLGVTALQSAIVDWKPDVIVHLAAVSSPAQCEADAEIAGQVNLGATRDLCEIAGSIGAQMVFLSTDWVFDGATMPEGGFTERCTPVSKSVYGRLKRQAEQSVLSLGDQGTVIRSSLLYGTEINGRRSTLTWLEDGLRGLMSIQLIEDEWRTPVYVRDAVQCVLRILELRPAGVFHCAGPERVSRAEFGEQYAECFGISPQLIKRVKRADVPELRERPEDLSLNSEKTKRFLDVTFRSPAQAFKEIKSNQTLAA